MLKITSSFANIETILKATRNPNFLTSEAMLAFLQLTEAFIKALILHHFDQKHYIRIEIDVSSYAIDDILSQLIPESDQWHLVAFIMKKVILTETRYKTHDQELLAIVEAFKT